MWPRMLLCNTWRFKQYFASIKVTDKVEVIQIQTFQILARDKSVSKSVRQAAKVLQCSITACLSYDVMHKAIVV